MFGLLDPRFGLTRPQVCRQDEMRMSPGEFIDISKWN
jgi:hypothetical protein